MRVLIRDQKFEIFIEQFIGDTSKAITFLKRQFKHGTAQMLQQFQQMIRVDQRLLRRPAEKIFGMMREELVQRIRRRDQHRHSRCIAASRPTRLLARARDGARIPDENRRAQSADVDSQFERVRGDNRCNRTVAQALLDLAALNWEITGTIASDLIYDL